MRYALISDIHANWQAWQAVLADIEATGVDGVICLGDIVGYGPQPAKVLESVYNASDLFVLGNHDAVICGRFDSECFNDEAKQIIDWTKDQLNDSAVDFFNQVPMMVLADDFAVSHAEFAIPERFDYIYDPHEAIESFESTDQPLLFCGHTHFPGTIRRAPDGALSYFKPQNFTFAPEDRYLINVGSVGDPRNGEIRAAYCIYDLEKNAIEFRNVPFDVESYRQEIAQAGIPTKPILFDYADRLIDASAQTTKKVREFHVDEDVARAAATTDNVERISETGINRSRKIQIAAGTVGDGSAFRSSHTARSRASTAARKDRKQNIALIVLGTLLLFLISLGSYLYIHAQKIDNKHSITQSGPNTNGTSTNRHSDSSPDGTSKKQPPTPLLPSKSANWQPPAGYSVYWNFDEGSGSLSADLSSNAILLNTENVQWIDHGVRKSALRFTGNNSRAMVSNNAPFDFDWKDPFSFCLWVRPDGSNNGKTIFSKLDPKHQRGYYCKIDRNSFQFRLMAHMESGNRIKTYMRDNLAGQAGPDGWIHLALIYDGSTKESGIQFYVNGFRMDKDPQVDSLAGSVTIADGFILGNRPKNDSAFKGDIDEFLLYPRALTPDDIKQLADYQAIHNASPTLPPDIKHLTAKREQIEKQLSERQVAIPAAIEQLKHIALQAGGDPLAEQILLQVNDLERENAGLRDKAWSNLKKHAQSLTQQQKFQEAAKALREYNGPYAAALAEERSSLALSYQRQHEQRNAIALEQKKLLESAGRHFIEHITELLLHQNYEEAFTALADNKLEFPDLVKEPNYGRFLPELEQVMASHNAVMQSFQVQKNTEIQLPINNKPTTVRVEGINDDYLFVRVRKEDTLSKPQPLRMRHISPAERLRRLGNADRSAGSLLMRGLMAAHDGNNTQATELLKQSKLSLGTQLIASLPKLDEQRNDEQARAAIVKLKQAMGVDPRITDVNQMRIAAYRRPMPKPRIEAFKQHAKKVKTAFEHTKGYKDNEPFFSMLNTLTPLVPFRPDHSAVGVYPLSPTSAITNGKTMRDFSAKRNNLQLNGTPAFAKTEFDELLYFDGTSICVQSSDRSPIANNAPFTILFWSKPERKAQDSMILTLGRRNAPKEWISFGISSQKYAIKFPGLTLNNAPGVHWDKWQFNIIRYSPPKLEWLVHNELQLIAELPQPLNLKPSIRFGAGADSADNTTYHYKGFLRDVHIYNDALSDVTLQNMLKQL